MRAFGSSHSLDDVDVAKKWINLKLTIQQQEILISVLKIKSIMSLILFIFVVIFFSKQETLGDETQNWDDPYYPFFFDHGGTFW